MATKVKPLGDKILVKRKEETEKTSAGGIIIPDTVTDKPTEGIVEALGAGRRLEDGTILPPNVKVGDKVLFGKYSGTDVTVDGAEYLIMSEDDVIGIID